MIHGLRVPVHLTSREALRIFDLADIWAARTGHDVRLVSANDHVHSRGSAHYDGRALDLHSSEPDGLSAMLRHAGCLATTGTCTWSESARPIEACLQPTQSEGLQRTK